MFRRVCPPGFYPLSAGSRVFKGVGTMCRKRGFWMRTVFAVLAAMLSFGIGFSPQPVEAASAEGIPVKKIPRKRIPKTRRYYQAPAFKARAKKNRKLVLKARRSGRRLRRTGSAYEDDYR